MVKNDTVLDKSKATFYFCVKKDGYKKNINFEIKKNNHKFRVKVNLS